MIPMLDSLLRDPAKGRLSGVRAIVIYPLNALIESQRDRLNAWTEGLKDRISYALYNGLTPEKPRDVKQVLGGAELGDRRSIRENPPSILITNVTMLEYLLLRAKDQSILDRSQRLLRWIVLDEAHGYIGAQAAEMALLLRRVRTAFGVGPEQVQIIATSATISEGAKEETEAKLKRFVADLAGTGDEKVRVIEGSEADPALPPTTADLPLYPAELETVSPLELWDRLASHPRIRRLRHKMESQGLRLPEISTILFGTPNNAHDAQAVLDAAARARDPKTSRLLLPWRAHLFHRAQGGLWACVDPSCPCRDPELAAPEAGWGFGAVWLAQRDHCHCGAPVFELLACAECGTPHLVAGRESGVKARLVPLRGAQGDEYAIDEEPDPDVEATASVSDTVWLRPARKTTSDRHLCVESGALYDNGAPADVRCIALDVIEFEKSRNCCSGADRTALRPQRYGAPFFMGNALPDVLERLSQPLGKPGVPMGGRRAITFSDSRQGVARLAAKLQQDAERTLTRSFLYHIVQEGQGLSGEERAKLEKRLRLYQSEPEDFADDIAAIERQLAGTANPVSWNILVSRFADQSELREFCTKVWEERAWGGNDMAKHPEKLAEMLLYRELFRRPRVQNNAETMGLVRFMFPAMDARAFQSVPRVLQEAGIEPEGWVGLAQAAIDFIFRDNFAVDIQNDNIARWINPRRPGRRSVFSAGTSRDNVTEKNAIFWPGSTPYQGKPSRFQRLIYRLIEGNPDDLVDQDRAREVLDALWTLITTTAARDSGRGAWRLDFSKAAVVRVDRGWLCPITRRIFGYTTGGPSPFGPADERRLAPVDLPRLPVANAGGLGREEREEVARWCRENAGVSDLRAWGLWTDLHDRIAIYPPFLRAQEHSAQIERPVLQRYEERFKEGQINLLNCSTTMEMGVDIPNVALVANSNVPPSISNYRQRVGRAGRRGEPWAFGLTFCRDLPLDQVVFQDPLKFLTAPIAAPAVRLDSAPIVTRHVHAALLGSFLRSQQGLDIRTSIGAFFGATEEVEAPVAPQNNADSFHVVLGNAEFIEKQTEQLARLVRGTILESRDSAYLCAETQESFEHLLFRWRNEYETLLERAGLATEEDVRKAFAYRARRMHGEFLLSELARRGFTPSYGFPVDVVSFDHISSHRREDTQEKIAYGEYQGGASRTLDVAIREYAPGAEIVIDGLVHQSEGLRPAWSAIADASGLEDLQVMWNCPACDAFGMLRALQDIPDACPQCGSAQLESFNTLRPTGFMGRCAPHTGYESLGHVPYEMQRLAARSPWQALPDKGVGRMRWDREGQVVTRSSGVHGFGYALCLCCGRAEAEIDELRSPDVLRDHKPLAPIGQEQMVRGACPGGLTQRARIQRNLVFVHDTRTDVFELQLPSGTKRAQGLALAAGLREALAEIVGAEAREIGIAIGRSRDEANARALSAFLFDKAAGGAGLVTRLAEFDQFKICLERAIGWLDCRESCENGCPACILRPDMNLGEEVPDRPGALELAQMIVARLKLPTELLVFGETTRIVGQPLVEWLERQRLSGKLQELTVFLHGTPRDWELVAWPLADTLTRLHESQVQAALVIATREVIGRELEFTQKLDLHRLSGRARLLTMASLPQMVNKPLVACVTVGQETVGIAAADPADAIPGLQWGLGRAEPLVLGETSAPADLQSIATDRLLELSSGNARLIRLRDEVDGPSTGFGARFWQALEKTAPLSITALRQNGVAQVCYQDRYLLTPLNFKLLYEVINSIPGRGATTQTEIVTAQLDRAERAGYYAFHPYVDDAERQAILKKLLPRASVSILAKRDQSHARSLEMTLLDGRRLLVLLDQGFGAWRANASARHDFRANPDTQAEVIKRGNYLVSMGEKEGMPIVIELR
ncbi:ATP-dependent helicase YprA (DUF1998 family) [Sinorhizobium kostiense]|uniref:ATP-dependent helicase YprA (DUF1998 family) n=2 Tax=Sinorhizobium kostiense TaxID=76747 RepID=A0ABS4R712_9HYPH|nr:ATP-dependent helicase YprA (DUF1998 family) [Sinorhizobium kostiense]